MHIGLLNKLQERGGPGLRSLWDMHKGGLSVAGDGQ